MQIQPIPEQAFNQAILTFNAMRQELLLYRVEVQKLQQKVIQLEAENKKLRAGDNATITADIRGNQI